MSEELLDDVWLLRAAFEVGAYLVDHVPLQSRGLLPQRDPRANDQHDTQRSNHNKQDDDSPLQDWLQHSQPLPRTAPEPSKTR